MSRNVWSGKYKCNWQGSVWSGTNVMHTSQHQHCSSCNLNIFIFLLTALIWDHVIIAPSIHLNRSLHSNRFVVDDEVKETVQTWIQGQLKSFTSQGIKKLVEQYKMYIDLQGICVETLYNPYVHLLTVTDIKGYVTFTFSIFPNNK